MLPICRSRAYIKRPGAAAPRVSSHTRSRHVDDGEDMMDIRSLMPFSETAEAFDNICLGHEQQRYRYNLVQVYLVHFYTDSLRAQGHPTMSGGRTPPWICPRLGGVIASCAENAIGKMSVTAHLMLTGGGRYVPQPGARDCKRCGFSGSPMNALLFK